MSIIPFSQLGKGELALLGNNLAARPRASPSGLRRRQIQAVNRSLAPLGERVQHLHPSTRRPAPTVTYPA